ncbi:MAG: ATP-binding protein [Bacteroidota bacterium]
MDFNYEIASGDFSSAGKASSEIKKVLKRLNISPKVIKRIVVAIYEAEVNVVAHSLGGKLNANIEENSIKVILTDNGPGIENVGKAMETGYSTASKEVREMGFGAGMGLPNIKKNTDELNIESKVGVGTTVKFRNYF